MPIHKKISYEDMVTRAIEGSKYYRDQVKKINIVKDIKKEVDDSFEDYLRESMDAERLLQQRK